MNKEHFMIELKLSLRDLDESERQDVMRDYLEHFENGLAEGKTEEQIAKELGSPSQIAKEILTTLGVKPQVKGPEYSQGDWVSFENEKNSLFILAHHRHVTHLVSARFNVSSPEGHDRQAHLIPSIQ